MDISESDLDKMAEMISCIWNDKQRKIMELNNKMNPGI
jgi:hypothetical protein